METNIPRSANITLSCLPTLGAAVDAVAQCLNPTVYVDRADLAQTGASHALRLPNEVTVTLTDPTLTDRAMTAGPLILFTIASLVIFTLYAAFTDKQQNKWANVLTRVTAPSVLVAGGAYAYSYIYFSGQPYHGSPAAFSGGGLVIGLAGLYLGQFMYAAREARQLKAKLAKVV